MSAEELKDRITGHLDAAAWTFDELCALLEGIEVCERQ